MKLYSLRNLLTSILQGQIKGFSGPSYIGSVTFYRSLRERRLACGFFYVSGRKNAICIGISKHKKLEFKGKSWKDNGLVLDI